MYQVLGIEKVDYVSARSGQRVEGYKYYLCIEDPKVDGLRPLSETIFLGRDADYLPKVAEDINILFDGQKVIRVFPNK